MKKFDEDTEMRIEAVQLIADSRKILGAPQLCSQEFDWIMEAPFEQVCDAVIESAFVAGFMKALLNSKGPIVK